MAGLTIQQEQRDDTLILRLGGDFDVRTASILASFLDTLVPGTVLLDFSAVRSFSDAGVAVATRSLNVHRVSFSGLDRHRERVFAYFGVQALPARPLPRGDSEEARLAG